MCKALTDARLKKCQAEKREAFEALGKAIDHNGELELTLSQCQEQLEKPTPKLNPCGTVDIHTMSSVLLDKLEDMGDDAAEIYLPDRNCKVFRKADVVEFLHLDETDKIVWVEEKEDCDDIAAQVFDDGLSLVWTNVHALNYFVDEDDTLWFVEPQSDKIARNLENWQGWDVRFFLAR